MDNRRIAQKFIEIGSYRGYVAALGRTQVNQEHGSVVTLRSAGIPTIIESVLFRLVS